MNWLTNIINSPAATAPTPVAASPLTQTNDLISDDALNLIVTEEDGAPAYYTAHL